MTKLIGNLIKLAIAALIFYIALMIGHNNANASIYPNSVREPALEMRLPTVVKVFRTENTQMSFALIDAREIYLSRTVADSLLNDTPSMTGHGTYSWAMNLEVLIHEWAHIAFQQTNEQNTEAMAWTTYRWMLRTEWGFTPTKAQRFYDAVVGFSPYNPVTYTRTKVDPLLAP